MKKKPPANRQRRTLQSIIRGYWPIPALVAVSVITRLPLLKQFDLVAFDGTYYIRQAMAFFGDYVPHGGYPIGYPFFIACLIPLAGDGVRAAIAVSFLFTVGSALVLYALGRKHLKREIAFAAALIFSVTPLVIRYSLLTMSESTFIFWVLLSLYFYARGRHLPSGLSIGLATITRPEAIPAFLVLALLRIRKPRALVMLGCGFVVMYSLNTAMVYTATGHLKILPKRHLIGKAFSNWRAEEFRLDRAEEADDTARDLAEGAVTETPTHYFPRLISEGRQLLLHLLPPIFLLALWGLVKRPSFLLAPLLQFLLYPFFNIRIDPRYILPYLPVMILYAFLGLETLRGRRTRRIGYGLLFVSVGLSLFVNRSQYLEPASHGQFELKEAGLALRNIINEGDKIADRKPYVAFYAEGDYLTIPDNTYDVTLQYLFEEPADYLSVHELTTKSLRPSLLPLLYEPFAINGELRFKQIYTLPNKKNHSIFVYKRVREAAPLQWTQLTSAASGDDTSPCWSPDGNHIAFQSSRTGEGDIYIIPASGGEARLAVGGSSIEELPSWSPDGEKIAFISNRSGNFDIFVLELASGTTVQVTDHPGTDSSPSWTKDGGTIIFFSDRTGRPEIWEKTLATGGLKQLTTNGDNKFLAASPTGNFIAWIRGRETVTLYNRSTGETFAPLGPKNLFFAPSWSPDEKFIAVTSSEWGSGDIYLLRADGGNALLLTKRHTSEGQPAWSPKGDAIALVSNRTGARCIWLISGLNPYLERLTNSIEFVFLKRESDETH